MDDLQFILQIAQAQVAEIKVLLMSEVYHFDSSKFILVITNKLIDGKYVSMNTENGVRELSEEFINNDLKTLLKCGVMVGYDNRLPRYNRDTYDEDHAKEYGMYLAFKNSGIKIVDPFQFVADSIRHGYEIIKW
jgi:hypothetical protein